MTGEWQRGYDKGFADAKKQFDGPYGEWEKKPEICYDYFYCSGCGYAYKHAFNFCPNCGLPMNEKALEILRKREGGKK